MNLVIAEKPSVAQNLAAVIGATVRKDGYLEGNGWRVSWCVGHLAGLADADSYDPKYAKWRYDDLPILPEHWQMVVGKDKKKQFDILKKLMNAPDVTEVVNACDAGREGELIFRSVYELAGCQKPMKRLWISSMEDSAIREGFANLRPGADYDGLRDAALCRAKADWLVGINATRLFSVLYHRTLNIGRVMSPTLALIVQRESEIDTFQPVPFYTVALELPGLTVSGERMADKVAAAIVKEGKSSPPQHFTEDTLLSAMETAGKDDMPEDAERKGLGTPATRAGILEKLVSAGFLERKKNRKTVQLLPSHDAVSLITVLPEQLQSPLLTAEWEYRLGEIERGQLAPEEFLDGISTMLKDLVGTYQVIKGTEYLFTPPREVVGKCPRCGGEVAELQKGFFCQNKDCKFAIWKNNKWWAAKKKQPTKAVVSALLKDGRVRVTGLYSEKTGKTYDAAVVLEDDGQYANFKLEFDQRKGGSR